MSKIKNGGLDQYGPEPLEQQQFGTVEGVNGMIQLLLNLLSPLQKDMIVGETKHAIVKPRVMIDGLFVNVTDYYFVNNYSVFHCRALRPRDIGRRIDRLLYVCRIPTDWLKTQSRQHPADVLCIQSPY